MILLGSSITAFTVNEVSPKGDFAYITVVGQGLAGELTLTSEAFVKDFFAFANFDENKIAPPTDFTPIFLLRYHAFISLITKPRPSISSPIFQIKAMFTTRQRKTNPHTQINGIQPTLK